ncbi:TraB/GumN family protein [Macellibacteroides fermentans]|uniref:TraB family protein n=1 Tax=Parabacteroides chartae TaxID=1037355 RepID=A0A1T5B1H4_9BACT|nr:TraB/GumN family protein [Parabacteroides chartae]SKB41064.1 TraB family protein [Parabacteroides chartae]
MKIINKFLLISHIVFLASTFCSASNSVKNGLLWKISGNGLNAPSYLFGTAHGGPFVAATLILDSVPHLNEIFSSVNQFVGERGLTPINIIKAEFEMDSTYADYLNKEDRIIMDRILLRYLNTTSEKTKISPKILQTLIDSKMSVEIYRDIIFKEFKPNSDVANVLSTELKHISDVSMDYHMMAKAKNDGYTIIGLDNLIEMNWENISLSEPPLSTQIEDLVQLIKTNAIESKIRKRLEDTQGLKNAYYKQDLDKIEEFYVSSMAKNKSDISIPNGLFEEILFGRSKKWMEHIPGIILEKPSFIAVGVAHLPGKDGLINLLRLQGFTVEPVN